MSLFDTEKNILNRYYFFLNNLWIIIFFTYMPKHKNKQAYKILIGRE